MGVWRQNLLFHIIMHQGDTPLVYHANTHIHVCKGEIAVGHAETDVRLKNERR